MNALTYTGLNSRFFLNVIIPVLVFKTAFCIDAHAFLRAWLQITIISIPGLLINGAFIGLLSMILIQTEWTYAAAILFGMICTPIYPLMIVNLLREIGQQKQIIVLLEGESIVGVASVLIVFEILLGYIDLYIIEWYQFVFVILRLLGGGKFVRVSRRYRYNKFQFESIHAFRFSGLKVFPFQHRHIFLL